MIKTHERDKLINAIVFFAKNTKHCGKIKLIKLLYMLDFEHFKATGKSTTGLDYQAWRMGPVPVAFFQEWEELGTDMAAAIDIVPTKVVDHTREQVSPKVDFDSSYFSRRELRILEQLAAKYEGHFAKQMVLATHEGGPWSLIWDGGRGEYSRIPYALALPDEGPEREAIIESARELEAARSTLGVVH